MLIIIIALCQRYGGVVELGERDNVTDKKISVSCRFHDNVVHLWATAANSTHAASTCLKNVVVVVSDRYMEERW